MRNRPPTSLPFEKINNKNSELAVTTLPDAVTVTVDGNPQGFTPLSLDTLSEGDHTIILSSPGFEDKLIRARTVQGFRLTVAAQLAKKAEVLAMTTEQEATPSAELSPSLTPTPTKKLTSTPTPTPTKKPGSFITPTPTSTSSASTNTTVTKPYVQINSPDVGYANVRSTAGGGEVLGKANDGEKFSYLGESTNGYHKIQYTSAKEGWVSGQYSTIVK